MISETCAMWLGEYRMDGLRFDSIKDVPTEPVQVRHLQTKESQGLGFGTGVYWVKAPEGGSNC